VALTRAEIAKRYRERHPERNRNNMHRTSRRKHWIRRMDAIVYLGGACGDCGYKDNLDALEFDHVQPSQLDRGKRNGGAWLYRYSWEKIKAELDRCELVCANCHRIRTAVRRRENQRHEQVGNNC